MPAAPSIVPRERVYGAVAPPLSPSAESAARLAAQRARERQEAEAKAWEAGFKAAELTYGMGVYYDAIKPRPNRMAQICNEVAAKHGYPVDELFSERRSRPVVIARQEAMWRCKRETPFSLPSIGRFMGGRDHTTVMHGIRRHEERMAKEATAK